jgi:hypothetical protein
MIVRGASASALAHQIGHQIGLRDSDVSHVTPGDLGPSTFGSVAAQDPYDVMGRPQQLGSLGVADERALGVLPPAEIHDVPWARGTYDVTLSAVSSTGGIRAIRLDPAESVGRETLLEFRSLTGRDSWLASPQNTSGVPSGVVVRDVMPSRAVLTTYDASPSEQSRWASDRQVAMTAGTSMRLGTSMYLTVRSMTAAQATIRIVIDQLPIPRDLDRDTRPDLVAADASGVLYKYPDSADGRFGPRTVIGRGWQTRDLITMVGDWDGSGAAQDIIAREPSTGLLWLYPGNGRGGLQAGRVIGRGWQSMNALFSPGDWNGDGTVDLIGRRRSDGALFLYPGNGAGGFGAIRQIGAGWNALTGFAPTGSYTNHSPDFFARTADGTLYLYVGDGHGGFLRGRRTVGRGFQSFLQITGVGDWRNTESDVLARGSLGELYLCQGHDGMLMDAHMCEEIGAKWEGYRLAS